MKGTSWGILPAILLLAGCRETLPEPPERVGVCISLSAAGTRSATAADEGKVQDWSLLLFREGKLADYGTAGAGASIRCFLEAGTYTAVAVANPPSSFQPAGMTTLQAYSETESRLEDNALSRLVMAGELTLNVQPGEDKPREIPVERLVCKAGVRKVSVAFTDPVLSARPFVLKAIFLTNCYGKTRYGSDLSASQTSAAASAWYNRTGFQSDPKVDGFLSERNIDATLTADAPHQQEHVFYFYPNPTETDSRDGSWSVRHTRLVLEAEMGGRTYYYPVTLPVSRRNRTYLIEEAVIRKLGSLDPEGNVPGAVDITFSTGTGDWNPAFEVQENS